MSRQPSPVSLAVSPAKQTLKAGGTARVTVADRGSDSLKVTTHGVILHHACAMAGTSAITVHPAAFTLHPGQVKTVSITVPDTPADYGVAFSGLPEGATGFRVAGGVGSQVVTGTETAACTVHGHSPKALAPVHGQGAGFPLLLFGGAVGLVVILAAAVFAMTLRRRQNLR